MSPKRLLWGVCVALVLVVAGVGLGAPVGAQEDELQAPTLIRAVNSRNPEAPNLQIMTASSTEGLSMTQDGEELDIGEIVSLAERRPMNLVAVLDTGEAMDESGALEAGRDALLAISEVMTEDDQLAVISAGEVSRVLTNLTTSRGRFDGVVESIGPSSDGQSALWTSIRSGARMLSDDPGGQPTLLVLTSGRNVSDADQQQAAIGETVSSGAAAFVVGAGSGFPAGSFESLVEAAGGAILPGADVPTFTASASEVGTWLVNDQYVIDFTPADAEAGRIAPTTLNLGDTSIDFAYVSGTLAQGAVALQPYEPTEPSGLSSLPFTQGGLGRMLLLVLVLLAVTGAVYALVLIFGPDEGALSNVLQPYSETYRAGEEEADDEGSALARTALLQRAVSITEQVADSQGYLSRTEAALERADMPLRAAEALFFYVAAIGVTAIVTLLILPPMGALLITGVVALVAPAIVNMRAGRRRKKFQELLPDTLQLLSGTLRAGYSLMQGVEAVSQEVAEPMGKELRRVVTEARLGRPLEEALEGVAERMASPDFAWAVMAIRIQREVGGNLSELLLTVAETMLSRERLRRDIDALTAEGRVSAMVLGALPIGLGVMMFTINPDYMSKLIDTTLGNILLGLALVGMGVGFAWMRQIIKIDI